MIITKEEVIERLRLRAERSSESANAWFKLLEQLKADHRRLLCHVHGVNVGKYIEKLEGLENDTKKKLRERLSRSNRSLFADILRPVDKVFSKQGGSKDYMIKGGEGKAAQFKDILAKVNHGFSFQKWLKTYFVDKYVIDPNGFFLVEHKDSNAYPTYKSILTIADYNQTGLDLDYVIFEPYCVKQGDKEIDYVRVYDDAADTVYRVDLKQWTISEPIPEMTFPNPWGSVPAVLCSDIEETLTGYNLKQTPIYEQVEDADEYLRINSVNTLQYYHHGFAKFWKHGSACKRCHGAGVIDVKGNGGVVVTSTCPACGGSKFGEKEDVSDVTYITPPPDGSKGIAPDIMGYITPPIESLKALDEKLKEMRDQIYHSHWGTVISRNETDKTAFEVSINTQPMQDRLNSYTDSLENIETAIVNLIGQYHYQEQWEGCSINYGRSYVIKGSEQLLTDYIEGKGKGMSYTLLNEKLQKYYNALYSNDAKGLDLAIKLMETEPWVHHTIKEAKEFAGTEDEWYQKLYYNDWLATIPEAKLYKMNLEQLKESLKEYTDERRKKPEPEPALQVQGVQDPNPNNEGGRSDDNLETGDGQDNVNLPV